MRNKNVGFLITGISVIIGIIIYLFNSGMKEIVSTSCSHGPTCPMYGTISTQTTISLVITGLIFLIGLFFIFSKENEKIIIKKIKNKETITPKKVNKKFLETLNNEEKQVANIILESGGAIYQSDLVEKSNLNKVKVTRILDSLEAKNLVERKRRGMANIVLLKSN